MIAHLEVTGGALRIYHDTNASDRDPFDFFVDVVGHERLAILKGLTAAQRLPAGALHAVRAELRRVGFTEMMWTRYSADGRNLRDVRVNI